MQGGTTTKCTSLKPAILSAEQNRGFESIC